jgi:MoaA/NifB/PqqE/SkfB family radical SAM enzyme
LVQATWAGERNVNVVSKKEQDKTYSSVLIFIGQTTVKNITELIAEAYNIAPEYKKERPPFPKRAKIEITNRCDHKCYHCQNTYYSGKYQDIDKDLLFRIIKELKELHVEQLGLFWMGEPLLVKELPEYIAFSKEVGISYVFITTNGRLATPDRMEKLFESGLDSVKFSISADCRENYINICGVDAFDQVISNLKETKRLRGNNDAPKIYASSVFDPNNEGHYNRIHDLILPYVDQHYPLRLYGKRKIVKQNNEYQVVDLPVEESRSLESMLPCWPLFTEPHINCDGYMSACFCDLDEKFIMGDLRKMSLMEAWHSDKYVALRKRHLSKDVTGCICESCVAFA